jgi:hypothetical protein
MFSPEFFMFKAARLYQKTFENPFKGWKDDAAPQEKPKQTEPKKKPEPEAEIKAPKPRRTQKYVNSHKVRAARCRRGAR